MWNDDTLETVFYVKIWRGNDVIYRCYNLPPKVFFKWRWFFEYRAALYQIETPRKHVWVDHGTYEIGRTREEVLKIKRDRMIADKRMVTQLSRQIESAKKNWSELWPIEDHPKWPKVMEKRNKYQSDLEKSTADYNEFKKSDHDDKIQ